MEQCTKHFTLGLRYRILLQQCDCLRKVPFLLSKNRIGQTSKIMLSPLERPAPAECFCSQLLSIDFSTLTSRFAPDLCSWKQGNHFSRKHPKTWISAAVCFYDQYIQTMPCYAKPWHTMQCHTTCTMQSGAIPSNIMPTMPCIYLWFRELNNSLREACKTNFR